MFLGETVKAKWQNLRDTFRRECNKQQCNTGDGTPDVISSQWKFYENMTFLKDTIMPRQTICNIQKEINEEDPSSPENSLSNDMVHEEEKLENHNTPKESIVRPDLSSVYSNIQTPSKRKKFKNNPIADLIEIEKQKLKRFDTIKDNTEKSDNYKDDEDFHFLMSMLPHLKEIPKQRKLSVRMKLQQVLIEEMERRDTYENSRSSTCTSNSFNPYLQSQPDTPTNVNENYNLQYLSSAQHSTDTTSATDLIFSDL